MGYIRWREKVELETKEFPPCPSSNPLCIQEVDQEYLYGMTEENIQSGPNEEANQGYHDYIEHWFQTTIRLKQHHSFLQQLFASYHLKQLVPHVLVFIKVYCSNLNVSIFVILLLTWLHWKY
jgi:hypothetical protein